MSTEDQQAEVLGHLLSARPHAHKLGAHMHEASAALLSARAEFDLLQNVQGGLTPEQQRAQIAVAESLKAVRRARLACDDALKLEDTKLRLAAEDAGVSFHSVADPNDPGEDPG